MNVGLPRSSTFTENSIHGPDNTNGFRNFELQRDREGRFCQVPLLFGEVFIGFACSEQKHRFFSKKNHIFRFFSIFLRRGSSRTSTNLLNDSKIRVRGLSFYCGTQLRVSQAPSALALYIKFTISKVQIFEILNKIDLGSIVVGSRIEGTIQKCK